MTVHPAMSSPGRVRHVAIYKPALRLPLSTLLVALLLVGWLRLRLGQAREGWAASPAAGAGRRTALEAAAANQPTSSGFAGTAAGHLAASGPARAVQRVFVVGCGHSGTSIVKRTIANLPNMHCVPKETQLFFRKAAHPVGLAKQLAAWDARAAAAGFTGWVEKTPKHIEKVADIWRADPAARVVFVVRDGREVAGSMLQRRTPLDEALQRWVADNEHILPHLADPRLLTLRLEDFGDEARVLGVLRRLSAFVGAPARDDRLLLALQASTTALPPGHQCAVFDSEQAKEADLTASYLQLLSGRADAVRGAAPNRGIYHNRFRSWQASQAWAPQLAPTWPQRLTCQQQAQVAADRAVRQMLQRFEYGWEPAAVGADGNGTTCQLELSTAEPQQLESAATAQALTATA